MSSEDENVSGNVRGHSHSRSGSSLMDGREHMNGRNGSAPRSASRSVSRSPVRGRRSLSRSPARDMSRSPQRRRSRSRENRRGRRSRTPDRRRYRSPSYSPRYRRRSRSLYSPYRRHLSRSPHRRRYSPARRSRYNDGRDNPEPCSCLGVFGMSLNTTERDLKRIFGEYGEIETVQLVYDRYSGRSRGFGFVYFSSTKEAMRAKEHLRDAIIDGMRVRVDFSVTKGAPNAVRGSKGRSRSRSVEHYRRRRSRS